MKTEHRLAEILKEMMSEVSLDEISVTSLTRKCHINRQTFYYHFHDIFDLLTLVFLDEKIINLEKCKSTTELIALIFNYYTNNSKFIDATINSAGKELFQEFIYNACYKSLLRFVHEINVSKRLHSNDKKAIARFYSLAYANSIVYYFATAKTKTLNGLKLCFGFEDKDFLERAVNNFINFRGK